MIPGVSTYKYNSIVSDFAEGEDHEALELKIVGILTPKENVSFGSLQSGIYYTQALTDYVLEKNADSNIENWLKTDSTKSLLAATLYNLTYSYTYSFDKGDGDLTPKMQFATIGPDLTLAEMTKFMGVDRNDRDAMQKLLAELDTDDMIDRFVRKLGGNDLANSITIYPNDFKEKYKVTEYLDKWNAELDEGEVFKYTDADGNEVTVAEKSEVNYSDPIELIVNLINTMIDIVSYALIAFTSVSLVVSTVMIGIITYVSVVERIKEIGVIRSLGGRKRDVSNLFIAETFIIGLLAGLIGVSFTYLVSLIVNLILKPHIGYATIAALPISNALLLIGLSVLLTLISGVLPARSAAKKDPVVALRTE
jgi:putative ABC transport system permease protein